MITKIIIGYKGAPTFASYNTENSEMKIYDSIKGKDGGVVKISEIDGLYVLNNNKFELVKNKSDIKDYFTDYSRQILD